jgi:hypothetical protein
VSNPFARIEDRLLAVLEFHPEIEWTKDERSNDEALVYLLKSSTHNVPVCFSAQDAREASDEAAIKELVAKRMRSALGCLRNLQEMFNHECHEAFLVTEGWVPPEKWPNPMVEILLGKRGSDAPVPELIR